MNYDCEECGLQANIGHIVNELHHESTRETVACLIMALFRNSFLNYLKDVNIEGNTLTFIKKDNSIVTIQLPIQEDDYVTGGTLQGSTLTLSRKNGQSVTVDLSNLIPQIDTSSFFASCEIVGNTIKFYNKNGTQIDSINLTNFENSILSKFPLIPGYYYKTTLQGSDQFNTLDTIYIGTTWDPQVQKPTSTYRYIYKVVSKNEYNLVASYKVPRDGYYYILSSGVYTMYYNVEDVNHVVQLKGKSIPNGVIGIITLDHNDSLSISRLDNYFIYLGIDDTTTYNTQQEISDQIYISYNDIRDQVHFNVSGTDNLGNTATANNCMFYPSRFVTLGTFIGKHSWDISDNTLVDDFNDIVNSSGYRYLFEVKYESTVDDVNIISDQSHDVINGDKLEGFRYTGVRSIYSDLYLGKAKFENGSFVSDGAFPEVQSNLTSSSTSYFDIANYNNWIDQDALGIIWALIMTSYFNSNSPDSPISTVCYSDNTGWYTTWQKLCLLNTAYDIVLNATTECSDGTVNTPGNGVLPEISDDNLPCSTSTLAFKGQFNKLTVFGTIKLNIGGRKWDSTNSPYRYYESKKAHDANVILYKDKILYKTTVIKADFTLQYWGVDGSNNPILVSRHVTF